MSEAFAPTMSEVPVPVVNTPESPVANTMDWAKNNNPMDNIPPSHQPSAILPTQSTNGTGQPQVNQPQAPSTTPVAPTASYDPVQAALDATEGRDEAPF